MCLQRALRCWFGSTDADGGFRTRTVIINSRQVGLRMSGCAGKYTADYQRHLRAQPETGSGRDGARSLVSDGPRPLQAARDRQGGMVCRPREPERVGSPGSVARSDADRRRGGAGAGITGMASLAAQTPRSCLSGGPAGQWAGAGRIAGSGPPHTSQPPVALAAANRRKRAPPWAPASRCLAQPHPLLGLFVRPGIVVRAARGGGGVLTPPCRDLFAALFRRIRFGGWSDWTVGSLFSRRRP